MKGRMSLKGDAAESGRILSPMPRVKIQNCSRGGRENIAAVKKTKKPIIHERAVLSCEAIPSCETSQDETNLKVRLLSPSLKIPA